MNSLFFTSILHCCCQDSSFICLTSSTCLQYFVSHKIPHIIQWGSDQLPTQRGQSSVPAGYRGLRNWTANHFIVFWKSWSGEKNRTTSSTKSRDALLRLQDQTLSTPWLYLESLSMKTTHRIGDRGQPQQSPNVNREHACSCLWIVHAGGLFSQQHQTCSKHRHYCSYSSQEAHQLTMAMCQSQQKLQLS